MPLHEDARAAHAGLPRADEGGERGAVDGAVDVEVVEEDHGALLPSSSVVIAKLRAAGR